MSDQEYPDPREYGLPADDDAAVDDDAVYIEIVSDFDVMCERVLTGYYDDVLYPRRSYDEGHSWCKFCGLRIVATSTITWDLDLSDFNPGHPRVTQAQKCPHTPYWQPAG